MENTGMLEMVIPPGATEVFPEPFNPERHFAFSALMVMATELYFEKVPDRRLCPYAQFSYRKLVEFVESRKGMTKDSSTFCGTRMHLIFPT